MLESFRGYEEIWSESAWNFRPQTPKPRAPNPNPWFEVIRWLQICVEVADNSDHKPLLRR